MSRLLNSVVMPQLMCSIMFWGKKRRLSDARQWGLAAGGILTQLNSEGFNELPCQSGAQASRDCLREWWDVSDNQELSAMLEWLWTEGHSADCREACQSLRRGDHAFEDELSEYGSFLISHLEALEASMLAGWDLCRLINVSRWGFTAGYVKEELAWLWILRAARKIQASFPSWKAFGKDFLLGYEYWRLGTGATVDMDLEQYYNWLLYNRESPWRQLAWKTRLTE